MRLSALILVLLVFATPVRADVPNQIAFDVYRNGQPFGEHVLDFQRDAGRTTVDVRIRLRAGLGPFTLFRYEHDAREVWQGDDLQVLESRTLKDGEELRVGLDGIQLAALGLPSSHWRRYETGSSSLINTETGEALDVTIEELGTEVLQIGGESIEAERIRMNGSVVLDLWYDADGNWVQCAFDIRGQSIEYRLRPSS